MKFLFDILRWGHSCSSSVHREVQEPKLQWSDETRTLMGRRRRRTMAKRVLQRASTEWTPTLRSISEDTVGPEHDGMTRVVKGRVSHGCFGSRSHSVSPLRVNDYVSRGNHFEPAIPAYSATPFII